MENSKLIDLLRSFTPREWRSFREMVASPYFNRNTELSMLADWLDQFAPKFEAVKRAAAHTQLFPGETPEEARLNHLMSFLLKLAEEFIALELYRKDKYAPANFALQALSARGLEKHYRYNLERMRRAFAAETQAGGQFYYEQYAFQIQEAERFARHPGVVDHPPTGRGG